MRRLILCRLMLPTPFHFKNLDLELWDLIWSYLNEYKYLWNAVNLQYLSSITCPITPGMPPLYTLPAFKSHFPGSSTLSSGITQTRLRRFRFPHPPEITIGPVRPGAPGRGLDNWFLRPILKGPGFWIDFTDGKIGLIQRTRDANTPVLKKVTSSINSSAGREILAKYQLQAFFEGYLQPEGMDEPIEVPNVIWTLEYEALQVSIQIMELEELQGLRIGVNRASRVTPLVPTIWE